MIRTLDPDWTSLDVATTIVATTASDTGVRLETNVGPIRIDAVTGGGFRLRCGEGAAADYGILLDVPTVPLTTDVDDAGRIHLHGADGASLVIASDPVRFELRKDGAAVTESSTDAHFVRTHRLPPLARTDTGWFLALALDSGEPFYGLGEKWGDLDRRGQLVESWNYDALGVNTDRSYKNAPFGWSPRGWGLFVHTPARVVHGVGYAQWSRRAYGLEVEDTTLDVFLFTGSPADIIETYTGLTGRPPTVPRWSLGAWMSRAYYRTADELLTAAERLRERKIPSDVITLDGRAWLDTATRFAFQWDATRYPDPEAVTARLHDLGYKVCCWEYPLVSTANPWFDELEAKGWLLTDDSGRAYRYRFDPEPFGSVLTPLPESGLIDFTNPDAYAAWRDAHAALFRQGVDVMKTDFGEQVTRDMRAANGDTGARLHNAYALLYNRCVYEATEAYFGEGLVFGRSGWAGSQRYPTQWGGDPQTDWEGLAASIRGGLSWAMSGVPWYATDIGGFYGPPPSPELYVRWTQAAVFATHFRFHGMGAREPEAFGPEAEAIVRDWLQLRYRLIPYLEGCIATASECGLPVQRPMPLAFPDDPAAWSFEIQYLFGPDLLVAPVVEEGGRVTSYLPPGEWFDFHTGQPVRGGRPTTAAVPLDRIPVFVRSGAVLPLGPAVQSTAELEGALPVERLVAYGVPDRAPCLPGAPWRLETDGAGARLVGVPTDVTVSVVGDVSARRHPDGTISFAPFGRSTPESGDGPSAR